MTLSESVLKWVAGSVALAGALAGTAQAGNVRAKTWIFHHENVLGTSLEMRVRAESETAARRSEMAALAEFAREDRILSSWRSDSELSRWMGTQRTAERVSPELLDALSSFDAWRERTDGALDASAEVAVRLWKEAAARNRMPDDEELRNAVSAMRQRHWTVDSEHMTATHLDHVPLGLNSFIKSSIASRAADEAMVAGTEGVVLNVGGDLVLRGNIAGNIAIADPKADAENDEPMDVIRLGGGWAMATSGGYRRGFEIAGAHLSHIVDPRTAKPAGAVLSSTVVSRDPTTAGALATAFSVLRPEESRGLAASLPDVEYLLVLRNGRVIESEHWAALEQPRLRSASLRAPAEAAAVPARPQMDVLLTLELARVDSPRYRRPYVAVWVEDKDHFAVRTLALWFKNPRWLHELKQWYRDDQVRNLAEGTDLSTTISSATRPPGKYTLRWDGKDNAGKAVAAGKYTICVETAREHGSYQVMRQEIDFDGKTARQMTLPGGTELAGVTLDYGVHAH